MVRQLPLDLALPPRFGREDFLASGSNAAALQTIDRWPDWPDGVLLLLGPEGAGKSHLGAIWAEAAGADIIEPGRIPEALAHRSGGPKLLEDGDRLQGRESDLFHLLNAVRDERSFLLITARRAPDLWGLRTADVVSRLRLAPTVRIGAPDDDLMRAVLIKLFADRQIVVDEALVAYLIMRLERSLGAARHVVDALDRESLALGRRVTRPVAARVLESLELDGS